MAEPLFILADVEISAPALRRWLKAAPVAAATFGDWPSSVFRRDCGISKVSAPAEGSVADELIASCVGSFGLGDGHLLCNYDEQTKTLRFAVCFQYGDEAGAMESAIFLCSLLRGIAEVYAAKESSFIRLFDTGGDLLCIEISKKASRLQPVPTNTQLPPTWFAEWISQDNLGDPSNLIAAMFPPLARALEKKVALGAFRASPQAPYRYDSFFWTDGERIYYWPKDTPVKNADPKTFRRITPANSLDSAFYADARQVWYHRPMVGVTRIQSLEPGVSMRGWRPFGSDGEPLLRCGDTAWAVAQMDCGKSASREIQSQGGIPTWEKAHSIEYLRPTQVDGASFVHKKDHRFEDAKSTYVQTEQGLIRMEGSPPDSEGVRGSE